MGIKYQGSPLADTVLSAAQVKLRYESNADTNEFDDAEKTKLGLIEDEAKDDQTGAEIKTLYQAESKAFTDTKDTKLINIEPNAKDDQTPAEIRDALHTLSSPNQLDADKVQEGTNHKYFFEAARKKLTGIVDDDIGNFSVSWDDGTQILTLTHVTDYTSYVLGVPVVHTGDKTKNISGYITEGWWWFWLNAAGNILAAQALPDFSTSAFIARGYWDATNSEMLGGITEERHGVIIDYLTRHIIHTQIGTRHESGLTATTEVVAQPTAPPNDESCKIWLTGGTLDDEGLHVDVVNAGSPSAIFEQILGSDLLNNAAKLPIWYRDGAGVWRVNDNDSDRFAFLHAGGNTLPYWNEDSGGPNWGLTAAANLEYVVYWLCANAFQGGPVFLIMHTAVYTSLEECLALTVADIDFADVDIPDITILYRLVFECKTAYVNSTHRTVLRDAKDLRGVSLAAAVKVPGFDQAAADAWLPSKTTDDLSIADNFKKSVSKDHIVGSGGQNTGAITTDIVEIATAETGDDVTLPPTVKGMEVDVDNTASGNDVDVYPPSGSDLGAGVNTPIILPGGLRGNYKALDNTTWAVSTRLGLILADITLYVATGGSDTTGDGTNGNPWATANRALEYLSNFFASPEITVSIQFADGHYSGLSTIESKHPCGAQILITGENTLARSMTSVESSTGSAGAWSIIINLDSVAGIIPDDLVNISGAAGGTKPTFISGCWPVTNVDVGNTRITITSTHNHATAPSGAVTADVVVLKSVLDFGANTGILCQSGRTVSIAKLGILSTGRGIYVSDAGLILASSIGVGAASGGAWAEDGGQITLVNCIFSNCSSVAGIYATALGRIRGFNIVCSGGADRGLYALNSSKMQINTGIATGNVSRGVEVVAGSKIIMNEGVSTGNGYGFFASRRSYISAVGNTVNDNTSADFSPAENTVGNEESYIDT